MTGAAEFWHWDSISYVANFLLNDPTEMEGGDLEIIKMEKRAGMAALEAGKIRPEQVRSAYLAMGSVLHFDFT